MNRIDRLLNILLILQRRDVVRAADLAAQFEVSPRTIYRDMDALSEMGVPLVATPSEGFMLVEGFYMPPVQFSPDEAKALALGARMLAAGASGTLANAANLAVEKITHILPDDAQRSLDQLAAIIHFYQPPDKFDLDQPYLVELQRAISQRRLVRLHYHSLNRDEDTERTVEPHTLTYSSGAWYLEGYCHLRRDTRAFRLNRIISLELMDTTFKAPTRMIPPPAHYLTVRVRFAANAVRWVRERQHYGAVDEEAADENGAVVMVYRVESTAEIKPWLLSWGAGAEVLQPADLRAEIRDEALRVARLLSSDC